MFLFKGTQLSSLAAMRGRLTDSLSNLNFQCIPEVCGSQKTFFSMSTREQNEIIDHLHAVSRELRHFPDSLTLQSYLFILHISGVVTLFLRKYTRRRKKLGNFFRQKYSRERFKVVAEKIITLITSHFVL